MIAVPVPTIIMVQWKMGCLPRAILKFYLVQNGDTSGVIFGMIPIFDDCYTKHYTKHPSFFLF